MTCCAFPCPPGPQHPPCSFIPTVRLVLLVQAVVNEDTTVDALLLQKENERLRKELGLFRQLQQVPPWMHSFGLQLQPCYDA